MDVLADALRVRYLYAIGTNAVPLPISHHKTTRQMEKKSNVRKPQLRVLTAGPKPAPQAAAVQWGEKEILALQEKARRHQRQYPAGGYQGL